MMSLTKLVTTFVKAAATLCLYLVSHGWDWFVDYSLARANVDIYAGGVWRERG